MEGNLTISSIPQQVGNITWYINGENQKYPNEGATFSLQVYPNGIEPENELYTGTNYNTGTYNSGYYNTGGLSFQLESQYLKNSFSPVHFSIAGNDF